MPRPKRSRIRLPKNKYKKLCDAVMTRDGWKCRCCKRRDTIQAHHIIFRSHGGDDADWNLITLCAECHDAVHERYLIIHQTGAEVIDASKKVTWQFVNGWRPSALRRIGGKQYRSP